MDDLFDFLFTIFVCLFLFFFLSATVNGTLQTYHDSTVEKLNDIQAELILLNYLKTPLETGGTMADLLIQGDEITITEKTKEMIKNGLSRFMAGSIFD